MKTDLSIYKISIAAIKRHTTMKPGDFNMTKFYEKQPSVIDLPIVSNISLEEDELIICSVFVNESQWTILTTKRIITKDNSLSFTGRIENFKSRYLGDFKGIDRQKVEQGYIKMKDDSKCPYFIETGKPSMIIIYGIMTVMNLNR
jgi:hypothetical protein